MARAFFAWAIAVSDYSPAIIWWHERRRPRCPAKPEGSAWLSGTQFGRFGADGGQSGMQRPHHLCAFTDCCGDAFDRTRSHITDRKDAAPTRLERLTAVGAGQHESLGVQPYARSGQPIRVRVCSDEQEQMSNGPPNFLA